MRSRYLVSLAVVAAIATPVSAFAAEGHAHGSHASGHMQHTAMSQAITGNGTVKAVKSGAITLAHEPIPALKWPAMTMDFKLKDPALAKGLKAGDAISFHLEQTSGGYVISAIEPAN